MSQSNQLAPEKTEQVQLLLLGQSGVGKSSLLLRYTDNKFMPNIVTTLGVQYKVKKIVTMEQQVEVQVWDTAGQQRYRTITPNYYRNVDGVAFVYDITDANSLENIAFWIQSLRENSQSNKIVTIMIGNKIDLSEKRVVLQSQAEQIAQNYQMNHFEASAKNNNNVEEIFSHFALEILQRRGISPNLVNTSSVLENPQKTEQKKEKQCC